RQRQHQVAGLRRDGMGDVRLRQGPSDHQEVRAVVGQRRAGPRPEELDAAGFGQRHRLDRARHPHRRDVRRALPDQDLRHRGTGGGPTNGYTAKSRVGWTGVKSFRFQGKHTAEGRAYSYNKVFDVDVKVEPQTELSYMIFPDFVTDNLNYPSTYSSVDLAFSD